MKTSKKKYPKFYVICMMAVILLVLCSAYFVSANQPPVADADPDYQTVYTGEEAWFTGKGSYDLDGNIVSYRWDFGVGICLSGMTVTYVFNALGNFTVTLIVTDDAGETATDTVIVNVVEEAPLPNEPMVWIESLTTDKQEYNINEVVSTTVIAERGKDMLTYVWEGTLTLEVFDDSMVLVYTEDQGVTLPSGGTTETHYFEFVLTEAGDYLVRAILYDMENTQVDIEDICITVTGEPSGGDVFVWIESLTTDKQEYNINELVSTTVIVERGHDMLTYVWEGTLTLEVFNCIGLIVYTEDQEVYLPCGGTTETHYFEFVLTEPGDYLVRAILCDIHNILVDLEDIWITASEEPSGGNAFVWIESLTTDKQEYNINELVSTTVIVERGNDMLDYVWEGTLTLKVYDDSMILVYTEDQGVTLPCGGTTETHYFEFVLTEPGDYLVRAILYDMENIQADLEDIWIKVTEEPSGVYTMVWIESLTTNKQTYNINELVSTKVVVKRGNDMLTYVWEGTLTLEVLDDAMVPVYTEDQVVYLPWGGMTEIHYFEFVLTEAGDYLVRATLYDMNDVSVDTEEIRITVSGEPSGGNGTVPPNWNGTIPPDGDETVPPDDGNGNVPSDELGIDLSEGSETGLFGANGGWQIALAKIGTLTFMALLAFANDRGLIKIWSRKK